MNGLMKQGKNLQITLFPIPVYTFIVYACTYIFNYCMYMLMFSEFRTNGNWEYNVAVHPGLSLDKAQLIKYNLHTTSKLLILCIHYANKLATLLAIWIILCHISKSVQHFVCVNI